MLFFSTSKKVKIPQPTIKLQGVYFQFNTLIYTPFFIYKNYEKIYYNRNKKLFGF